MIDSGKTEDVDLGLYEQNGSGDNGNSRYFSPRRNGMDP